MVSRNKWRRLCVFAPLREPPPELRKPVARKGAKTQRPLRRNATLCRHLILLALTDFVVGARVKGNARQMSDKLKFVGHLASLIYALASISHAGATKSVSVSNPQKP
jgi:hypothetical protein